MNREQMTEKLFTTPEILRVDNRPSSGGMAAQAMIHIMDAAPLGCCLDRFDWETLRRVSDDIGNSRFLNRLIAE